MPDLKRYEGKATAKTRKRMESILQEWYGEENAPDALIKYLPQPQNLEQTLDSILRKKIPAYRLLIFRIQEQWSHIAGEAAAKHTRPFCLKDGILDVEVSHPAYRVALSSKTIKNAILAKVRAVTGEDQCHEIRFIPAGRQAPQERGS